MPPALKLKGGKQEGRGEARRRREEKEDRERGGWRKTEVGA